MDPSPWQIDPSKIIDNVSNPSRATLRDAASSELILRENSGRWVLLPVEFPSIFEFYKKIETLFWTPQDVTFDSNLVADHLPLKILKDVGCDQAVFSGFPLDHRVLPDMKSYWLFPDVLDITCELTEAVQSPEARAFFGFQNMFENLHREAFTLWNKAYLGSGMEYVHQRMSVPSIIRKQKWLRDHLDGFIDEDKMKKSAGDPSDLVVAEDSSHVNPASIPEILVAYACCKIFCTSSLRVVGKLSQTPPNVAVHETCTKVSRDLALQSQFLCHLYSTLEMKLDIEYFRKMILKASILEYNYMLDVFAPIGDEKLASALGALVKNLAAFIWEACQYDRDAFRFDCLGGLNTDVQCPYELPEIFRPSHTGPIHVPAPSVEPAKGGRDILAPPDENAYIQSRKIIYAGDDLDF